MQPSYLNIIKDLTNLKDLTLFGNIQNADFTLLNNLNLKELWIVGLVWNRYIWNHYNPDKEFNCTNLDFENSITCMNQYVQSIYNYTVRDENEYNSTDGELEDLKMNGGDCYDWNNLYVKLAKNLSLMGTHLSIYSEEKNKGHGIAIIWNKDLSEYCVLDQRSILGCQMLGGNNETV